MYYRFEALGSCLKPGTNSGLPFLEVDNAPVDDPEKPDPVIEETDEKHEDHDAVDELLK